MDLRLLSADITRGSERSANALVPAGWLVANRRALALVPSSFRLTLTLAGSMRFARRASAGSATRRDQKQV